MGSNVLIRIIPYVISLVTIFFLVVSFFLPQIQGKALVQGDTQSNYGMSKEIRDYVESSGDSYIGWTNSMFGGMPAYQINGLPKRTLLPYIRKLFGLGFYQPIGTFFIIILSAFVSMVLLKINPWISLIISICLGFASNHVILWEAGHSTKLLALAWSSLVIVGMILTLQKQYLTQC